MQRNGRVKGRGKDGCNREDENEAHSDRNELVVFARIVMVFFRTGICDSVCGLQFGMVGVVCLLFVVCPRANFATR